MEIRRLEAADLPSVQHVNLQTLPESNPLQRYLLHLQSWPQLCYVAVAASRPSKNACERRNIVGYVLARIKESDGVSHGHITSLMLSMVETFQVDYASLNVRVSNMAARHLYQKALGFNVKRVNRGHYDDGEDSCFMRIDLRMQVGGDADCGPYK
ncbi:N-alpha-acetyltransferase 10 [Tolypocladium ophioglossoides CBS 100239]|uniref:N-alpha-acetyltransferase 10 n=1 Tax=Tolypocladium ophioglossoides (strain CBS 100239) TaxID=1163406 RepID=A0A0L0MYQ7_TOLOC|nr:N-alpha-acetyltransferase 10 [Tolypocladium ophioglossoides CBS 100239]